MCLRLKILTEQLAMQTKRARLATYAAATAILKDTR